MIFVDTGAWYASEVEDDVNHQKARRFAKTVLADNVYGMLVTSDYVLDETLTLLRTRRGLKPALDFAKKIRSSRKSLQIVWVGDEIFDRSVQELSKYDDAKDQDLSFTDCTSFSIMSDLSITNTFAFDSHFRNAGFTTLP